MAPSLRKRTANFYLPSCCDKFGKAPRLSEGLVLHEMRRRHHPCQGCTCSPSAVQWTGNWHRLSSNLQVPIWEFLDQHHKQHLQVNGKKDSFQPCLRHLLSA